MVVPLAETDFVSDVRCLTYHLQLHFFPNHQQEQVILRLWVQGIIVLLTFMLIIENSFWWYDVHMNAG